MDKKNKIIAILIVAYIIVQIGIPLRHYAYPGMTEWTGEGERYVWHMMLYGKSACNYQFVVTDESGKRWVHSTDDISTKQYSKMEHHPLHAVQYAHYVADRYHGNVTVNLLNEVSLNDRPCQELIDSTIDLSKTEYSVFPNKWIKPLD